MSCSSTGSDASHHSGAQSPGRGRMAAARLDRPPKAALWECSGAAICPNEPEGPIRNARIDPAELRHSAMQVWPARRGPLPPNGGRLA